jgi:hypothetical protein
MFLSLRAERSGGHQSGADTAYRGPPAAVCGADNECRYKERAAGFSGGNVSVGVGHSAKNRRSSNQSASAGCHCHMDCHRGRWICGQAGEGVLVGSIIVVALRLCIQVDRPNFRLECACDWWHRRLLQKHLNLASVFSFSRTISDLYKKQQLQQESILPR